MQLEPDSNAAVMVIFGAAGDLTWRKLIPALYNLFLDARLPEPFAIVCVDGKRIGDEELHRRLRQGVGRFSRRGEVDEASWSDFASRLAPYLQGDLTAPDTYAALEERLSALEKGWNTRPNRIFYLAVPPALIASIVRKLGKTRAGHDRARTRIVIEKPFGRDLKTAGELNDLLAESFREPQIYRIDHYLGKETVQNLLALRFANSMFEPVWNRRYVDHVQITVAEQLGVEHRGGYYDRAGALRDMVQNHLLQILSMVAMEPPVSFDADEIRNKKVDVLRAIRPIPEDQVHSFAVRGQYGAGWIEGQRVVAYRDEPEVAATSTTETFAAIKLYVDNWRWQDVPFYLRTGKRLPSRISEVIVQFKPVPHQSFPAASAEYWQPNRLVIRIQPDEGIALQFQAKQPGPAMRLSPVEMRFSYKDAFGSPPPDAYEALLLDIVLGDPTLSMRADQVQLAWSLLEPVLRAWESVQPLDMPNYQAGTWGPEASRVLIARDGRTWLQPAQLVASQGGTAH